MSHRYFTLLSRDDQGHWEIEFGDYSRGTVQDELRELRYQASISLERKELKIITTSDDQASINAAVADLNR